MTGSPISWNEQHGGYWAVTGYQECRAAAGARDGFASSPHVHIPPSGLAKRGLRVYALESDGDEHCDIVGAPGKLRPELRDLTNTLGFRAATEDQTAAAAQRVIEIAGATIASRRAAPPGDWLDTLIAASPDYAAANRDPGVYSDPERFELDRRPRHLAFGWGRHRCVGMHLARAEMRIAAAELLAFAPGIELAEPVRWRGPAEPERLLVRSAAAERAVRDSPGRLPEGAARNTVGGFPRTGPGRCRRRLR
jgi:cytochrome P450